MIENRKKSLDKFAQNLAAFSRHSGLYLLQ